MKASGQRKLLLVNKRDREIELKLPSSVREIHFVDQTTKGDPPATETLNGNAVKLRGLSVAVVVVS